jgi:hypothetical protein
LAWLTEEVADAALAVDVALSVPGAAAIVVAVVEARSPSATVLEVDVKDVEFAVSGGAVAAPSSVEVALVDVAVSAATMPVSKVPTMMKLVRRMLATENAITLFFIPSTLESNVVQIHEYLRRTYQRNRRYPIEINTSINARRNITILVAVRVFAERASPSHSPMNVGASNMNNLMSIPLDGEAIETPFSPSTANKINISAAVITRTATPNIFLLS